MRAILKFIAILYARSAAQLKKRYSSQGQMGCTAKEMPDDEYQEWAAQVFEASDQASIERGKAHLGKKLRASFLCS